MASSLATSTSVMADLADWRFSTEVAIESEVNSKRDSWAPISARTLLDYQRVFDGHLGKRLGKVRVCDLSRSVIFSFLENTGAQEATRKSLVLLNQILDRAVDLEHIELNPARTIKPAAVGGTMGQPRERHLLVDELAMLEPVPGALQTGGAHRPAQLYRVRPAYRRQLSLSARGL